MAMVRTFVAIGLPAEVRQALARQQESLDAPRARYAKWVDPGSIHVTLKFLGNVDESLLPRLAEALKLAVSTVPAFRLRTGQLGAFPNPRNPRVVWIGLEGELNALLDLHRAVENALAPLGFPPEGRGFAPHLTLARVRETATRGERVQLARLLAENQQQASRDLPVYEVLVMRSDLDRAGARYTPLYVIALAG